MLYFQWISSGQGGRVTGERGSLEGGASPGGHCSLLPEPPPVRPRSVPRFSAAGPGPGGADAPFGAQQRAGGGTRCPGTALRPPQGGLRPDSSHGRSVSLSLFHPRAPGTRLRSPSGRGIPGSEQRGAARPWRPWSIPPGPALVGQGRRIKSFRGCAYCSLVEGCFRWTQHPGDTIFNNGYQARPLTSQRLLQRLLNLHCPKASPRGAQRRLQQT